MKTALIFGVTGQDGSYLSELLISKGYRVVGVSRRVSVPTTERLKGVLDHENFKLVGGDVTDPFSVYRLMVDNDPQEVYNLAAQSHVGTSFEEPSHTWEATAKGTLNCLEGIRHLPHPPSVRFYQASSSEMFGANWSYRSTENGVQHRHGAINLGGVVQVYDEIGGSCAYQNEDTPFAPNSPYAIAKLAAHHLCRVYRDSYGIHASSGILFNHESSRRGETFVTRKITKYVAQLAFDRLYGNHTEKLKLGNLAAVRDWGHAEDYVRAMWLMLQQDQADDYVIATGETHSVEEFLVEAFGMIREKPDDHWETDKSLYRPCEVSYLRGDASKAKRVLEWVPTVNFRELVRRMVLSDLAVLVGWHCAKSICEPTKVSYR